jgi:hypothetical protein
MKIIIMILSAFITTATFAQIDAPYTVVAADKMNVLYAGIDNPITIAPGKSWKNTTVLISEGTITGKGSARTVRVSKPGTVVISLINKKDTSNFLFRVKNLPSPIFKIGSGKRRMASAEFKAQSYCRAELENFDFDFRAQIISAHVIFLIPDADGKLEILQGDINSNALDPIVPLMRQAKPGTTVIFKDIMVQYPDGPKREMASSTYMLY